jgi:hypothetical protein
VTFGEKEAHLRPLNGLIERHHEPMRAFINALCSPEPAKIHSLSDSKVWPPVVFFSPHVCHGGNLGFSLLAQN